VLPREIRPHLSRSFALFIIERTCLNELQQQLDKLIKDTIQPIDDRFTFTQKVKTISFNDIHALTDDDTASYWSLKHSINIQAIA
jgi:hypothetical protein